jgi:hypothetical protein
LLQSLEGSTTAGPRRSAPGALAGIRRDLHIGLDFAVSTDDRAVFIQIASASDDRSTSGTYADHRAAEVSLEELPDFML